MLGWYELWINYDQKKATLALQLVWTTPDSGAKVHEPPMGWPIWGVKEGK